MFWPFSCHGAVLFSSLLLFLLLHFYCFSRALLIGPDSYYAQDARTADRRRENSADDYRDKGREPYRQSSRSPPRYYRGRDAGYRDRDREGYRSPPSYDMRYSRSRSHSRTRSRTRSRSRSYSRSQSKGRRHARPLRHYGTESREIMMEGLPVDMTEEDVRPSFSFSHFCFG